MKRLTCILAVILLLMLFSACQPEQYDVNLRLEHITAECSETVLEEEKFQATLVADETYKLPATIEVSVGGDKLDADEYSYDPNSGDLTIPGELITGDVKIKAKADIFGYLVSADLQAGIELSGDVLAIPGQICELKVVPSAYYQLPETVTVSVGGEALPVENYTYDAVTGEIIILDGITGEITLSAQPNPIVYALDTSEAVIGIVVTELLDANNPTVEGVSPAYGYRAMVLPVEPYGIPNKMTVLVDGTELETTAYTYDSETGVLSVPGEAITGDLKIEGIGYAPMVGKWQGTVDMTEFLVYSFFGTTSDTSEYFDFHDLFFTVLYTFNDDATVCVEFEQDSVDAMIVKFKEQMKAGLKPMLQEMIDTQGLDMDVDEYMSLVGMDLDTMLDDSINKEDMGLTLSQTSLYLLIEDKLYITAKGTEVDKDNYLTYTIVDNNMVLVNSDAMQPGLSQFIFPLSLALITE